MATHKRKPKIVTKFETEAERIAASREAGRRYRERNRAKVNARSKEVYEERKATAEQRRLDAPCELTCSVCGETKSKELFAKAADRRTGYAYYCLECNRKKYGSGDYLLKKMFSAAKDRASRKNIPFNITPDYVAKYKVDVCPILGIPIVWDREGDETFDNTNKDFRPSLDKIVPELGYVKGNIRIVSWRGNRLKSDATLEETQKILEYLIEHQK